jgi:hypothetical protein
MRSTCTATGLRLYKRLLWTTGVEWYRRSGTYAEYPRRRIAFVRGCVFPQPRLAVGGSPHGAACDTSHADTFRLEALGPATPQAIQSRITVYRLGNCILEVDVLSNTTAGNVYLMQYEDVLCQRQATERVAFQDGDKSILCGLHLQSDSFIQLGVRGAKTSAVRTDKDGRKMIPLPQALLPSHIPFPAATVDTLSPPLPPFDDRHREVAKP